MVLKGWSEMIFAKLKFWPLLKYWDIRQALSEPKSEIGNLISEEVETQGEFLFRNESSYEVTM